MENSNVPSADETVKIYDSKNNEVQLKFRHGPKKQLLAYEQNPSKRVDSRRWYKKGFAKKMTAFKTKTGDESLLVLKNRDKNGELTIYTTNPQELSYSNMQGEEAEAHTLNDSVLNSTPIPSFTELARASPSKGKTSERINIDNDIDDKHCRICKIKFESAADVSSDSPWMGCVGVSGGKECNYWVHSGFGDASEEEVQRLNFYCPEHNKRAQTMRHGVNAKRKCGIKTRGGKRK